MKKVDLEFCFSPSFVSRYEVAGSNFKFKKLPCMPSSFWLETINGKILPTLYNKQMMLDLFEEKWLTSSVYSHVQFYEDT